MTNISAIAFAVRVIIIAICHAKREKIFAMATRKEIRRAREALDERTASLRPVSQYAAPRLGWVRAIRDALGMSAADLGRRMNISRGSVRSIEEKERTGGVRLSTLRRAAEAMDCTLVYALIPNDSLEGTVRRRAQSVLQRHWDRVHQTMALEDQAAEQTDSARESQLEALVDSGRLWSSVDPGE